MASVEPQLNIMSFNIFNDKGDVVKIIDKIRVQKKQLPDLIFTQEDSSKHPPFGVNYQLFDFNGYGLNRVCVYYNINTVNKSSLKTVKKLSRKSRLKGTFCRNSIIVKYAGYTIANLHLEGGRYFDKEYFTNTDAYLNFKLSLLNDIIEYSPNVILGDFNSIYSDKDKLFNKFLDSQYNYFKWLLKFKSLTSAYMDDIYYLNVVPYEVLQEAGYIYSEPLNADYSITNSRGKTIVDTIWYFGIKKVSSVIINGGAIKNHLFDGISDHNPVYASISK
jgi:exonuclease III